MTMEVEGPCSEDTNVTSMESDIGRIINSSDSTDRSNGLCVVTNNDCTCNPDDKFTTKKVRTSSPRQSFGQPSPAKHQSQRGPFRGITQFGPIVQCICHAYKTNHIASPDKYDDRNSGRFVWKWTPREYAEKKDNVYEFKVKRNHYRHYSKPHARGEVPEGIPQRKSRESDEADSGPPKYTDSKREFEEITERIDIYYFDHGNSAYFRTTDSPPILATEKCAEKTDYAATRFWAEIFGTVHIGVAFVTAFFLQLLRFILFSLVRPLTVGILQLIADYFVKPFLAIIFNAVIQPFLILLYNIATSFRDLCEPIAEALGLFLREIAVVIRALRIVEVNRTDHTTTACT